MTGRFTGRTALVTGGGSGIGRAAALRIAEEGGAVAVLDIRAEAAAETAELIAKNDGQAVAVVADVSDAAQVDQAVDRVADQLGRIDVVYNNAGTMNLGSVADTSDEAWQHAIGVHATGTFLVSRAALRHMGPGGAIVNQGSVAALVGIQYLAAYTAGKGAVVALTRSMAVDLAERGIRVNAVCPGTVVTPLTEGLLRERGDGDIDTGIAATTPKYPLGRLGSPDDIASAALYLASDDASFMTGSVLTSDGGMTAQ